MVNASVNSRAITKSEAGTTKIGCVTQGSNGSPANSKLQSQIPWLSQIPVLGALFRSSSYIKNETDLVIIVTPRLVRPAGPGEQLATPFDKTRPANDPEFFLLGELEVTKDMVRAYEQGTGVVGPYGHMLDMQSKDQMTYVKK